MTLRLKINKNRLKTTFKLMHSYPDLITYRSFKTMECRAVIQGVVKVTVYFGQNQ